MRLRRAAAAALVLVAFFSLSTNAGANRHHYTMPAGGFMSFELEGSNGYLIGVSAGPGRRVSLTTVKEGITTAYSVWDAGVGTDQVKARLPGMGLISVRFHQRGSAHHLPMTGCDGPRMTLRKGVARGTIRFVGEREYTRVDAHEADAESAEWEKQRCRFGTPGRHSRNRREWTNGFQVWEEGNSLSYFSARKYRPGVLRGGRAVFTAETSSYVRSLRVHRRISVVAPASTFRIPEPDTYPEHVILTPPAPFSGSGTFARTPESVFSWEGDLSVQFPGIDPLPLTGPRFSPHYCALRGCVEQEAEESESGLARPAG